jgi:hypothetical protein
MIRQIRRMSVMARDHAPCAPPRQARFGGAAIWRDHGNLTHILLASGYFSPQPPPFCRRFWSGPAMFILSKYENSVWPRIAAPLLAGLLVAAGHRSNAQAETTSTYVISDQDGYGVLECLTERSSCGRIVADAWCEAHGHGAARAFGRAEDVTASITANPPRQPLQPGAAVVSCAE